MMPQVMEIKQAIIDARKTGRGDDSHPAWALQGTLIRQPHTESYCGYVSMGSFKYGNFEIIPISSQRAEIRVFRALSGAMAAMREMGIEKVVIHDNPSNRFKLIAHN